MKHLGSSTPKAARPWLGVVRKTILLAASLGLSCMGLELLLRTVPRVVPRGVFYGSGSYDSELGFHLPTSMVVYNKVRYVERTPNADGFMDVDHAVEKLPGVVRVGFFGDSYVESVQLPLEDVFFRRLPRTLDRRPLEAFGFGLSGLGTLHARSLYQKFGSRYDLDFVVYLFVDNDPGDHLDTMQRARRGLYAARPTAVLSAEGEGFEVLRGTTPGTASLGTASLVRRLAMVVKDHSLLARIVYARLQLLSRDGGSAARELEAHSPPSTWPPALRREGATLTRRLLRAWQDEVRADGREFLVFYVPRSKELETDLGDGSWRTWLIETCLDLDIALVDPTVILRERGHQGDVLYNDHWSPTGHKVVAEILTEALAARLAPSP